MSCHSFAFFPQQIGLHFRFFGRHLHNHSSLTPLHTTTIEGLFEQVLGHPKRPDFIDTRTSGFTYDSMAGPIISSILTLNYSACPPSLCCPQLVSAPHEVAFFCALTYPPSAAS